MITIRRPSSPSAIAINLNQTMITKDLAALIVDNLIDAGSSVMRVTFVGLDKEGLKNMKKLLRNSVAAFSYKFFDDFAKAKDWLV